MDDFNPEEEEEQSVPKKTLGENISSAKENITRAKETTDKLRNSKNTLVNKGVNAVSDTSKNYLNKVGGKQVGKAVSKLGASKYGAAAKGISAAATAAKGALAASGIGTAVVLAGAALKKTKEKFDKLKKTITNNLTEEERKKRNRKYFIILAVIFGIMTMFSLNTMYLGSEDTFERLNEIIEKREKKNNKPLLEFTDEEIDDLLYKDYEMDNIDNKKWDVSYKTYLNKKFGNDYIDLMPNEKRKKGDDSDKLTLSLIKKYLKSSRYNLNKINWSGGGRIEGKTQDDILEWRGLAGNILNSSESKDDALKLPRLNKYCTSGLSEDEMKKVYLNLFSPYLQHWFVPFTLNIASQDNKFGENIVKDMYHPVITKLYELETKVEITGHNCDRHTEVIKTSEYVPKIIYAESMYEIEKNSYKYTPYTNTPDSSVNQSHEYTVTNKEGKTVTKTCNYVINTYSDKLEETDHKIDKYKVSYYGKEKTEEIFKKENRDISRIEWYLDLQKGDFESFPKKKSPDGYTPVTTLEDVKQKYTKKDPVTNKVKFLGYSYSELYNGFLQINKGYQKVKEDSANGSINIGDIPEDGFAWPVPGHTKITSGFGKRKHPITGKDNDHTGIDIGAGYGTPIISVADGTVIRSSSTGSYGNCILIDHGNGYKSRYAHMNSLSKYRKDDTVKAGDIIGYVGSTGASTGPHLHFEILKDDIATNPMGFYNPDCTPILPKVPTEFSDSVERWRSTVTKALQDYILNESRADITTDVETINRILAQITNESSGDTHAINRNDKNATVRNDCSVGLIQCIAGTFNAHKSPSCKENATKVPQHGQISKNDPRLDAYQNIYACIHYCCGRYGNLNKWPTKRGY